MYSIFPVADVLFPVTGGLFPPMYSIFPVPDGPKQAMDGLKYMAFGLSAQNLSGTTSPSHHFKDLLNKRCCKANVTGKRSF